MTSIHFVPVPPASVAPVLLGRAIEQLNHEHPDVVLFIARDLVTDPIAEAVFTDADETGINLRCHTFTGRRLDTRLPFAQPPSDVDDFRDVILDAIQHRRALVVDREPLTSVERLLQCAS